MSKNLFKEAIADAKAVKETAIESAKAALEEAFTPHLKSMLSAKLSRLDESEDNMDEVEDSMYEVEDDEDAKKDNLDEMDLEEILKELESLEGMGDEDEEPLEESKDKEADKMKKEKDKKDVKKDMKEEVEDSEEETEEEFSIEDMSEDDLKSFIEDVISDMMNSGELEGTEGEEEDVEMDMDMDMDMGDDEAPIDELDVNELLAEIEALEEAKKKKKKEEEKDEEKDELKKDLKEALNAIEAMKVELNEINLLNAKLLYTNKIFKAKNLTESEKIKVLSTFDKATTVKETKLVYETLLEGLSTKIKSPIKESLGSASKAMGIAKKQPIIETNEVFARMQKLAGIK